MHTCSDHMMIYCNPTNLYRCNPEVGGCNENSSHCESLSAPLRRSAIASRPIENPRNNRLKYFYQPVLFGVNLSTLTSEIAMSPCF